MSLNNIIDSNDLRDRLRTIIRREPDSGRKLSAQMKISTPTLMAFLENKKACNIKTLSLILKWVESKEKNGMD